MDTTDLGDDIAARDVWVVLGMRGYGKSTRVGQLVRHWRHTGQDHVVLDLYAEHDHCRTRVEWTQVTPKLLEPDALSLSVTIPSGHRDDQGAALQRLAKLLHARHLRRVAAGDSPEEHCVLVVEEVSLTSRTCQVLYEQLATQSRHWGISLVLVSQWATSVPLSLRRQATRVISYRQTVPGDVAALAELVGEEKAAKLPTLKVGQSIDWR